MIPFVTLQQAKTRVHIRNEYSDDDVSDMILQASSVLYDYLKYTAIPASWQDASSPPVITVPDNVQLSTLLMVAELNLNREASNVDLLSNAVKSLLMRLRDPALA